MKTFWAVKEKNNLDESKWHTGEFDRMFPPNAYIGTWEEAQIWTCKESVLEHVRYFGGEPIEFSCEEPKQSKEMSKHIFTNCLSMNVKPEFPDRKTFDDVYLKYLAANLNIEDLMESKSAVLQSFGFYIPASKILKAFKERKELKVDIYELLNRFIPNREMPFVKISKFYKILNYFTTPIQFANADVDTNGVFDEKDCFILLKHLLGETTIWSNTTDLDGMAKFIKNIIDEELYELPSPINIGQEEGISIINSVNQIKGILNYNVEVIKDITKQDGAPIKVLGKSLFKKYFPNFEFTDYKTGITNTINYYQKII
jgi:hypothetical protein